jgi:hypothetical protein
MASRRGIPVTRYPSNSIIVTDGYWMHIRHTRIHHRHYPEVRGEGRSLEDAATHLENKLAHSLDLAHGHGRPGAIERILADIRALRSERWGIGHERSQRFRDAVAAPELSTIY